jgi:bifunctional DNA-binding transcriptional regulator/antitoxin component of YhaV-PrlF toxin-antitoxin module
MTSPSNTYPDYVTWDDVLSALRGGEYLQAQGGMLYASPLGDRYDALGVMADLCGAEWKLLGTDEYACDDDGETHVPSAILEHYGLDKGVSEEEVEDTPYGPAFLYMYGDDPRRYQLLIFLNDDMGYTLGEIADEIERLGYDK